jgi:hypothetical protein
MATPEKPTLEQAESALREMLAQGSDEEAPAEQPAVEEKEVAEQPAPAVEEPAVDGTVAEKEEPDTEEAAAAGPAPAEVAAETDDIASLKKRLDEAAEREKKSQELADARWKALQERSAQNEKILRERHLKKSTAADRARQILVKVRTEGLTPEEVEKAIQEIESSNNPESSSYVAPPQATEDQAIVLNGFLNEKGMTGQEAEEFGAWIRSEGATKLSLTEQGVAGRDLDAFLRIAHSKFQEGMREKDKQQKRNDTVEAVRTVQRAQKDAARAASASPTAPRKTTATAPREIDPKKLTNDDVHALLKMTLEDSR